MKFKFPNKTVFYDLENAIKSYRQYAQLQIDKAGYKITLNQLLLLYQISEKPDLSQIQLSKILLKDVASTTRMIQIMVEYKFLTRKENSKDRRKKMLLLTDKGKEVLTNLKAVIVSNRETALTGFSDLEISNLTQSLNKLIKNVK